jgi:epoxyqueuosine reductase
MQNYIKEEALKLGFADIGFVKAEKSKTFPLFTKWLSEGYAGEMSYLSRNTHIRANPRDIMPDTKTVIIAVANYPCVENGNYISGYAMGSDYHIVLREKLKLLAEKIQSKIKFRLHSRVCIDSAPVLERELAVRAGLGWIGKQSCLVHPQFGCCIFLSELFVNIDIKPTNMIAEQCKDCTICLRNCPTGAIRKNRTIDARKCISYLTTEYKGSIPEKIRPKIGSSLFGCDRCTASCPFNKTHKRIIMPEFRDKRLLITPEEFLTMNESAFKKKFQNTALLRTGLQTMQRNAAVVLGNEQKKVSIPLLKQAYVNASALVKEHIKWALSRFD